MPTREHFSPDGACAFFAVADGPGYFTDGCVLPAKGILGEDMPNCVVCLVGLTLSCDD